MENNNPKMILSGSARDYLQRKLDFYRFKNRKPCLVQVAKTCQGAKFAIVYTVSEAGETLWSEAGLEIYLAPELITEYGGFNLDTELFFFTRRLLVSPLKQSYQCECKNKCSNKIIE